MIGARWADAEVGRPTNTANMQDNEKMAVSKASEVLKVSARGIQYGKVVLSEGTPGEIADCDSGKTSPYTIGKKIRARNKPAKTGTAVSPPKVSPGPCSGRGVFHVQHFFVPVFGFFDRIPMSTIGDIAGVHPPLKTSAVRCRFSAGLHLGHFHSTIGDPAAGAVTTCSIETSATSPKFGLGPKSALPVIRV